MSRTDGTIEYSLTIRIQVWSRFTDLPLVDHHSEVRMRRQIVQLAFIFCLAAPTAVHAQEFKVFGRTVQIHGFASQGFLYTDQNNWLTMHSSQVKQWVYAPSSSRSMHEVFIPFLPK